MFADYKPTNPVVIIGLGGTGQWVLTYIKKNLFETWGRVPANVRLLAFDTTEEKSDSAMRANTEAAAHPKNQEEKRAQVGNIALDANEYVYFNGDLYEEAQRVANNPIEASHLSGWFQGKYYLNTLSRGQFYLSAGAGKLRQFGRMGIFLDLARGESRMKGAIERALTEVRSAAGGSQMLHVFVVSSLVGGTGSGMFIDVAHIVRKLLGNNTDAFRLHGFLALQNTFQQVLGNDDYSRVYAAFRELSRFQQVLEAEYPVYYAPPAANREPRNLYRGVSNHKLFDFCYLVDSKRNSAPLDGIKPELSVYPSVAECITMALDPQTSKTYFDAAINETADSASYQRKSGRALFFSLGTYTYILPVDEIIEKTTYRMAQELLAQRLMRVTTDPETGREFVTWDSDKVNLPSPGEAVRTFMTTDIVRGASDVRNISFVKQMGVEFGAGPFTDPQRIQYMAELGGALVSWLEPVSVTDASINQATENLKVSFQDSLVVLVSNGDVNKEPPDVAPGRIQGAITQYKARKLGQTQRGQSTASGEVPRGLLAWREANKAQFMEFLKIHLGQLLNGDAGADPLPAKTHKLAYAREFLDALIKAFNEYSDFIKAMIQERAGRGLIAQYEQSVESARQYMLQSMNPNLWEKLNSVPRKRQDEYIQAEDDLYCEQRNNLLYQALFDQNSDLRAVAQNFRAQVEDWVSVLGVGGAVGPKQIKEEGVLDEVRALEEALSQRRNEARDIRVFEYLTDKDYEDRLYRRYTPDDKWKEVLGNIQWYWEHDATEGGPKLKLAWGGGRPQDRREDLFNRPDYQDTATLKNRRLLLSKLRAYFDDIRRNETVIERLRDLKGLGVVRELMQSSAPLIAYTPGEAQHYVRSKNYICINPGPSETREYYDTLRNTLDNHAGAAADRNVVALTNPHRCIMLSAAYHLVGEELPAIREVRTQYLNSFIQIDPLKTRHNFPAEIAAVRYEKAITSPPIRQPLRLLSPQVVSLLDDEERFKLFVSAWLFGLVRLEAAPGGQTSRYVLRLDRLSKREDGDAYLALTRDANTPVLTDAIRAFVSSHFDDQGNRLIASLANEAVRIFPDRVAESIQLRSRAVLVGYDLLAEQVRLTLEKYRDLLNEAKYPDAVEKLTGAMRVYIAKYPTMWLRSEPAEVQADVAERVMEANLPWLAEEAHKARLSQILTETLVTHKDKPYGKERREVLLRHHEKFIEKILALLQDGDQVSKDLGAVMHIMVDDMMKRIESQD